MEKCNWKEDTMFQASACVMARSGPCVISTKYIGRLNRWNSRHNANDKCSTADSSDWVIYPRQGNTHPILPGLLEYLPRPQLQELNSIVTKPVGQTSNHKH
jgi:hypothetical protein